MPRGLFLLVLLTLVAALLIPTASRAQTASYTHFGKSASGCHYQPPTLLPVGVPRLGSTTFALKMEGGFRNASLGSWDSVLITGLSNRKFAGMNLPVDIGRMFGFGFSGSLYTSIDLVIPVPPASQPFSLVVIKFPIPNDRRLLGIHFYQQIFAADHAPANQQCRWAYFLSIAGRGVIGT